MSKHGALDTFGRSGNPIIRSDVFTKKGSSSEGVMTLEGAVNKTGILLFLTVLAASISWNFQGPIMSFVSMIGVLTALVSGIATFGSDFVTF